MNLKELVDKYCPNGVKSINIDEICKIETGKLNANSAVKNGKYAFFTTSKIPSKIDKYNWDKEALLISGNADVGSVKYYKGKFNAYQRVYVLSNFEKEISVKYVYFVLTNNLKQYLSNNKNKSAMTYILLNSLKKFKIPVPSLPVQEEIVRILDKFTNLTNELNKKLKNELDLRKKQYEYYRDKLLSFDGSWVVNMSGVKYCYNCVKWEPLWKVTVWDKKFNGVEKSKQDKVIKYNYILSENLKALASKNGKIKLLTTSFTNLFANERDVNNIISEGEVVYIPWGGTPIVQYYNGKFVTGDNRIATSLDTKYLSNKFLYYTLLNKLPEITSFYRGSGIKHPNMSKILDLRIPVPPLSVQKEIVKKLDRFTNLINEFTNELDLRKKQYEYYRDKLLSFDGSWAVNMSGVKYYSDRVNFIKIKDICKITSGEFINKIKQIKNGKYPIYNGGVTYTGFYEDYNTEADKVIISARGAAGFVNHVKRRFWAGNSCHVLNILSSNLLTRFLYFIMSKMVPLIISTRKEGTIPSVTQEMVYNLKIPVPPLPVQEEIVRILDKFTSLNNKFESELDLRKKQYEYYRDKLLSFKGTQ